MKKVSCQDMGKDCDFVAMAETEDELVRELKTHAQEAHKDFWESKLKDMSDNQIKDMVRPHVKEA